MSNAVKENTILKDLLTYQTHLNGQSSLLEKIRKESAEKVKNTPFPTTRDEDWRFTNLKPLTRGGDFVPDQEESSEYDSSELEEYFIPESENTRLVFINGRFSTEHSSIGDLPEGTLIGNLAEFAAEDHKIVEEHLNQYAEYEEDIFTYFNGAFLDDGSMVYIPQDTKVESPIHILNFYTNSDQDFFTNPRTLVVADKFSKSTVIEEHIGLSDNRYLTVPVVELKLFEGANVKHLRIQRDSRQAIHISRPVAHVARHSKYESYTITLGARLSRNDPKIVATDEEVDFTVDGLVLIDGDQIADTHSVMDHQHAHATSHQLHKCVINGEAHSVFNGKIFVRQGAQKIDSFQENRNLLLSRDGHVNTKPQLEIFADDVVCTHGATIGSFEDEELFYLESRGLSGEKARELITYGFALETIENIEVDSIHQLLLKEVERYSKSHRDEPEAKPVA